jgi:hypothetical protein
MFKQLYILVSGLLDSLAAVFWVTVLCALFLYTCSIVLTQVLGQGLEDAPNATNSFCLENFSSVITSMLTLFDLMAAPDFGLIASLFSAYPCVVIFFVFFTIGGTWTMISLLTGVISEGMMEKASNRKDDLRDLEERKKKEFLEQLTKYFKESDQNGDGLIHRDEFNVALPELTDMFQKNDFSYTADDLALIFDLIDFDKGGTIELHEFINGVTSFTANVSDLPMHLLKLQCNMHVAINACEQKVATRVGALEGSVKDALRATDNQIESLHAKIDRLLAVQ